MSVNRELNQVEFYEPAPVHYGKGYHRLPQEEPLSLPYTETVPSAPPPQSPREPVLSTYAPAPQSFGSQESFNSNTVSLCSSIRESADFLCTILERRLQYLLFSDAAPPDTRMPALFDTAFMARPIQLNNYMQLLRIEYRLLVHWNILKLLLRKYNSYKGKATQNEN